MDSPFFTAHSLAPSHIQIDPRVKLMQSILLCSLVFAYQSWLTLVVLFCLLAGYMWMLHVRSAILHLTLCFVAVFAIWGALTWFKLHAASIFFFYALKFIPLSAMTIIILRTVSVREIMLTLSGLRIPRAVIVSAAVAFRCLPSFIQEFRMIVDSMRLRGIAGTPTQILLHPLRTAEWIVIPLLIRGLKMNEELAMAALTRGADSPGPKTSLLDLRFKALDFFMLAATGLIFAFLFWIESSEIMPALR